MTVDICNTLALYDIDPSKADIKGWYEYVLNFFKENEQTPGRAAIVGTNIKPFKSTKTFKHCDNLLRTHNFKDINYIWFASHPPKYYYDVGHDLFNTQMDIGKRNKSVSLGFSNEILSFNPNLIKKLAKDMSEFFDAGYGIFFQRDKDKGPSWYVSGAIGNKGYSEEEEDLIAKWMHLYNEPGYYYHGLLRDIYPLNFIARAHLEQKVGNSTLEAWINSSPKHGTLTPLTDRLWTWEVPQEDISFVRETLRLTGIIICI